MDSKILLKLVRYCAYQERCASEIRKKLTDLEVESNLWDEYFDYLAEEGYWNEARFVEIFCRSKFSLKSWGKFKIKSELLKKGISEKLILPEIEKLDGEDYKLRLKELLTKKMNSLKGKSPLEIKQKTYRYGLSKGFSSEEILKLIGDL